MEIAHNSQHPSIKFTIEREAEDNSLPMLDLKLIRENNKITTDIYRKPTHTDQYLQWSSHHPVQQKLGIVRTLMHRANTLITDEDRKKREKEKIKNALRLCGYPEWALKEGEHQGEKKKTRDKGEDQERKKPKGYVVLPYIKGVSERLRRTFQKQNINLYHKAGTTLRQMLVHPKDKLKPSEQCGAVYQLECQVCQEKYIGESGRSLLERIEEHQKSIDNRDSKSALSQHQETTGHIVSNTPLIDNTQILEKEARDPHRKVLEAINIRLRGALLNRNDGADLPDLYLPLLREEGGAGGDRQ